LALTVFDAFVVYASHITAVSQDIVNISHKYHRRSYLIRVSEGTGVVTFGKVVSLGRNSERPGVRP